MTIKEIVKMLSLYDGNTDVILQIGNTRGSVDRLEHQAVTILKKDDEPNYFDSYIVIRGR